MGEVAPIIAAPFTGGASLLGGGLVKNALRGPSPPRTPAPVTTATKAVQDAAADAAQRRSKARGFQSTILKSFLSGAEQTPNLKATLGS